MITVKRLNHAVMWVRDAQRSYEFYRDVLGFELVRARGKQAIFIRANGSDNDHDLGLFTIGMDAPEPTFGKQVGLYHLAWEVESLPDLAHARVALMTAGALVGESDHGHSLSLYARDPDMNEFEVLWVIPVEEWDARGTGTRELDLVGQLAERGYAGMAIA